MTQVRIIPTSSTIFDEIDLCEQFYEYRRKKRYVPFMNEERLDKGLLLHQMLANHYREIGYNMNRDPKKHYDDIVSQSVEWGYAEAAKSDLGRFQIDETIEAYRDYAAYYVNDSWYPVLDSKGEPLVEAPFTKVLYEGEDPLNPGGIVRIVVFGKIDLLLYRPSMTGGERCVVDHKSGARYVALNPLANQYYTYAWATGILKVGQNNAGFQQAKNENKFRRDFYSFQQAQIDEWVEGTVKKVLLLDAMASQGFYPRRTTGCFKFGPCRYLELCAGIPASREAKARMLFKTATGHNVYQEEKVIEAPKTEGEGEDPVEEAQESVSPLREQEGGDPIQGGQEEFVPPVREDGGPR